MKLYSAGAVVFSFLIAIASISVAQTWNLQLVDDVGNTGFNTRIAVTSDETPYILYEEGSSRNLYLAWRVPAGNGGWDKIHVGSGHSGYQSSALVADSHDNLHLAWFQYKGTLWYRAFDPSSESFVTDQEPIAQGYNADYYPSMDIFDNGGGITPIVAYAHPYDGLYCATRDSITGVWSTELVYGFWPVGSQNSVAVGSTGQIYITFYEPTSADLMYATKHIDGASWAWGYIDTEGDVGLHSSIVIDASNIPHVIYYDQTNGDLKYAKVIP
jgi:outer membrane protein assembly factor BamB